VNLLTALSYPPILTGFLVLLVSGAVFPVTGVFILRLHLVPLRFVMMHGALLGGALALLLGINPLAAGIGVNLLVIAIIAASARGSDPSSGAGGRTTTFLMIITVALAFLIIYKANIPAKDTLTLLWGSIFALDRTDLIVFAVIAGADGLYILGWRREITAVLYDRTAARAAGVRADIHYPLIVVLAGLTVSLAMRFIGALLLDAVLLLPAFIGLSMGRSARGTYIKASAAGFLSVLSGYTLAIVVDIPVSSSVTFCGVALYAAASGAVRLRRRKA
jgi:zinc transport system permease protein